MLEWDTAPDGTYQETINGLVPFPADEGYFVGLQTNTRAGMNAHLIGIWTAPDGEKFVDPARWVLGRETALKLAKAHEQRAIWDCEKGTEIYV